MAENMNKYEQEFIVFYDKQSEAIFRYCYFRVYDRERAKELMQEAFMKTWEYLASGKEVENLKAFVYRVANNLVIDNSRKNKGESSIESLQESGFEIKDNKNEFEIINNNLEIEKIKLVMDKLEPIYSQIILLRYVNGLRPKDIAEMLEESEDVVSVRINRGLKKLKVLLKN